MHPRLTLATNAFPAWVLAAGVLGFLYPPGLTWFSGPWITWGLAVIMLGMGITLSLDDFRSVVRLPKAVGLGFAAQFTIMPLLGYALARLFHLPTPFAVGLILVACCPGGTASNVVTFLARGHLALSVLMTMCSTFGAILLTPTLSAWLAGQYVPVPAWGLFLSTVKVVLAPVVLGLILHHSAPKLVRQVLPIAPLVSVVTIALICGSIIASSSTQLRQSAGPLLLAVLLLHTGGFSLGYALAHTLRFNPMISRTISIEVGMQNSGLGAVLAHEHFANPITALPAALSATAHSVLGSLLAAWWRLRTPAGE